MPAMTGPDPFKVYRVWTHRNPETGRWVAECDLCGPIGDFGGQYTAYSRAYEHEVHHASSASEGGVA